MNGILAKISNAVFFRSLGSVSGLLLTFTITSHLPLDQAGLLLFVYSLIRFSIPISVFGTNTTSLRFIGSTWCHQNQRPDTLGFSLTILAMVLIIGIILSTMIWLLSSFLANFIWNKPELAAHLKIAALIIIPMSASFAIASFLQAIQKTTTSIFISIINIAIGLSIAIFFDKTNTVSSSLSYLLNIACLNFIFAISIWLYSIPLEKIKLPEIKAIFTTCIPIWTSVLLATLIKSNGQLIAGSWVTAEELAFFIVAQRIAFSVSFVMVAINLVTAPIFAALHKQEKNKEFKAIANKTTNLMIVIGGSVFIIISLFSDLIMGLFGEPFGEYGYLLIILALGQLINTVTGSSGYALLMSGHEKAYRNIIFLSCILSVFISLILIPLYGLTGAAVATALGVSIQHLGAATLVKKKLGFSIFDISKSKIKP